MLFTTSTQVRFAHIDAAAIVFYPRYFEMLNGAVEDWFAEMGCDFRTMHVDERMGVPTVKLECDFIEPSFLGDTLAITLNPLHLGTSSCKVDFSVSCDGQDRLRGALILVCMDLDLHKSRPWPQALRQNMLGASEAV
jgi:4-hydroxybenzoyl-CoA thioesterase